MPSTRSSTFESETLSEPVPETLTVPLIVAPAAGIRYVRFSSGRSAEIRYMVDSDALLLLHTAGRAGCARSTQDRCPT